MKKYIRDYFNRKLNFDVYFDILFIIPPISSEQQVNFDKKCTFHTPARHP